MKLSTCPVNIETSEGLEGKIFSIGDAGLLFDILRSKMYSNPVLAICREYVCNAIDSHREAGKPEEPIQICLPNNLESYYRVKDFGVGISPDRMENIFIKYGSSTKREDDVQMGAFGLGAKCAFSMVDSFAVNTIYNGIEYKYACVIDETKVGKLFLLSKSLTKESNGTEIVIPVEPKDFNSFYTWTEHVGRHLKIKPTIRGKNIEWKTPTNILEGNGWAISNTNDYNHQAKMIIDGIEYPLALDALRTYADTKVIDACRGNVIMYFGVGELTLSASREQIYLDKRTQDKIRVRLEEIQKDIKTLLDAKIDAFPNLWLANIYYRKLLSAVFNDLSFLGKLEWKGIQLHNSWISVNCPAFTFNKGRYSRKYGTDPNKLSRSRMTSLHFEENSELFINDLPIKEPSPRHVKKAFENDPKLTSIQVLCPTDTITEADLNKSLNLDKMAVRKMSELIKATGRAYTASAARLLIFKFDANYAQYRQVSYASIDEDTNDKVLCLLQKENYPPNTRLPLIKKNQGISLASMKTIANKNSQTSFYGVDQDLPSERVEEEFGDFESLEDYIDQKVLNNKTINYVEIKFALQHHHRIDEQIIKNLPGLFKLITDPDSIFLKRAMLHKKVKDISDGDTGLLSVYESIKGEIAKKETIQFLKDNPDWDLEKINKEYNKYYPLLEVVEYYQYSNAIQHIAQYVNLIDTWNKVQNKTN